MTSSSGAGRWEGLASGSRAGNTRPPWAALRTGGGGECAFADVASVCLAAAVSYANYKKTPPPVPPRTTSRPLISVTAQSSTESTQDAYQEGRAQRGSPWAQDGRGLYNSTDSLDSTKALSLALETAAQRHAADGPSPGRGDKAILVSKAEEFLRGRLTSIGVQVAARCRHGNAGHVEADTAGPSRGAAASGLGRQAGLVPIGSRRGMNTPPPPP